MLRRTFCTLGLAIGAGFGFMAATAPVAAQTNWPERTVKVIVPYAPGGASDLIARPWADRLSHAFGQQFVIDNRAGAGATLGTRAFERHPIPQDVWREATDSSGGTLPDGSADTLSVSLTVARGGATHGPVVETWKVAPGRLSGTIYYNSYGTELVKNSVQRDQNGNWFGAAVLGIKVGMKF